MGWSLSLQLEPDEQVLEDSSKQNTSVIKATYSVFLTNKRVLFRFDGLGSSLTQSFRYNEIQEVKSCKRIFVDYLSVRTRKKEFFLNIPETAYWTRRINEMRNGVSLQTPASAPVRPNRNEKELASMLYELKRNSLLTETELEEKLKLLESLKLEEARHE